MADSNIGVDIGYGFTKTYNSNGAKIFPTAITKVVPVATFSDISPIIVNSEKFLVGEDAVREGKGLIDTRTTTFVRSNAWLAALGYALSLNGYNLEHNKDGIIVLGIPPGQYSKSVANDMVETVKGSSILYDGQNYTFRESNFKVIPQGSGIFFTYVIHDQDDFKKDIAVIDIGHYTVDMLFFSEGKYIEGVTRSNPMGVSMILDDIVRAFYSRYGLTIQHKEAYKLLRHGAITILEESYTMDDIQSMVSPYAAQIASLIDGFFENLPSKPEIGLVGGGGVTVLRGLVKLKYKLHIVNDPEMANAMGYWYYARGNVS